MAEISSAECECRESVNVVSAESEERKRLHLQQPRRNCVDVVECEVETRKKTQFAQRRRHSRKMVERKIEAREECETAHVQQCVVWCEEGAWEWLCGIHREWWRRI